MQVEHIATLIDLPQAQVHKKLSQMILDRKFHGILDQGAGCLVVFDDEEEGEIYPNALNTIKSMEKVTAL